MVNFGRDGRHFGGSLFHSNLLLQMLLIIWGVHGLLSFGETLGALERSDVVAATDDIKDSDWYKNPETKSRAENLITAIRRDMQNRIN